VILADVSGSMDRYVRFLVPFLLVSGALVPNRKCTYSPPPLADHLFRPQAPCGEGHQQDCLRGAGLVRRNTHRESLQQFHERYGQRHLNKRTVVVIMSDGWDLGARSLLQKEMQTLSGKVHSVIWLNPLAGDPEYKPLCRGMQAVLPYVDHVLAADSLYSLRGRVESSQK